VTLLPDMVTKEVAGGLLNKAIAKGKTHCLCEESGNNNCFLLVDAGKRPLPLKMA
jgi:hypothetical protein